MTCYNHPGMGTVAVCGNCGKECCAACITLIGDRAVCRDCAIVLRSQLPPEPAETTPEESQPEVKVPVETPEESQPEVKVPVETPEESQPEVKVPVETPTSLPAIAEQSRVLVPVKPSAMVPATPPSLPTVNDPGAGGPREKESLLSAALSLILPGAGQAFNGQIVKGVILAVLYLGSMAAILVLIVLAAVYARSACLFCLPAFILPLIVLVYAIYDAYDTAEKINNGHPASDWL